MIPLVAALRSRNFLWLWLGQTVSTVGDRMVLVALALYVTQRTGAPEKVGVVLAANALPMGRFAEAREIASAALFLASDEASYITASTFLVDGGLSGAYVTPE